MRIREIAQARVRYGYRKIRVLLNREGWDVGKYLVYRLYKEEGLTLKRMKPAGKRKAVRTREDRLKPTAPNEAWSMDFVADQLQDGTRFRALTIVDVYTCQGRSKTRPVWRSKSRPVVGSQVVEYSGAKGLWSVAEEALRP
jgi:putative transposase